MLNRSMQAQNAHLLNSIQPPYLDYNQEMMKHGGFLPNNLFRNEVSSGVEHLPNIMGAQKQQQNMQMSNSKSNLHSGYNQLEAVNANGGRTMTADNYIMRQQQKGTRGNS